MEKETKSCTGVLLRADLTGHSHPTFFGRNRLIGRIGHALLGQPSKGHIISTTYQKIGDLFCSVHIPGLLHSVKAVQFYWDLFKKA